LRQAPFFANIKVSKVINIVVAWHAEGNQSQWFLQHMDRVRDYLWFSYLLLHPRENQKKEGRGKSPLTKKKR